MTPRSDMASGDVCVRACALDLLDHEVQALYPLLSDSERHRADRFCFPRDRTRFVVARGLLRTHLGAYLGLEPGRVVIAQAAHGKPYVETLGHVARLGFNLSHSGGLALYAFSWDREVGIDVEQVRPLDDLDRLASRSFSPREYAEWRQYPRDEQLEAFFRGWTRKEAFVKAIGLGLSYPLGTFDVSLGPSAALLRFEGPSEAPWTFQHLDPSPGYVATVVAEGESRIVWWDEGENAPGVQATRTPG